MKRLMLSVLLCLLGLCSLARADYPVRTKVYFNLHIPYTVRAGEIVIPPGEYALRDLGIAPTAILALSERGKSHPLAILYTVRIDRRLVDWTDRPRVVFDEEGGMPALKKIYIPSEDGYEIIGAVADKKLIAKAISVTKTETVVETPKVEEKVEEAPAPQVETPAPVEPTPEITPAPAPQPEAPPVAPIKERKRVRKD